MQAGGGGDVHSYGPMKKTDLVTPQPAEPLTN